MKHLNSISFGFVITFVLAACLAAAAQGVGVFTPTGSLNTARSGHTATLLANGKVLVAGGETFDPDDGFLIVASAELYDPATGIWTPTGSMGTARARHTATLLANGKVLVAGGYKYDVNGNIVPLAGAELYDPATGTWTPTGNLDRKSTRLNSSHLGISYAVFFLKKEQIDDEQNTDVMCTGGHRACRIGDGGG